MGKKQASVYAYRREIDAWWHDGRQHLEQPVEADSHKRFVLWHLLDSDLAKHPNRAILWVSVLALGLLAIIVIAVALLGPNVQGWRDRLLHAAKPPIQALAVLPLANLSADPEQEYFAGGMREALITEPGKTNIPRVISRQSVMQYKGSKKPLQEIARELNVDAVLEGAVVRSGDRVRVNVHLDRASPEGQLWASAYDRSVRDILRLQEEIARTVTNEVQVKLTPQERPSWQAPAS